VPSIPTVTNNLCNFKSSSQTNIYNESSTPEPNYDISIDPFESSYTSPHNTTYGVTVTPPLISKAPNPKRLLKVAKNEGAAAGRVKAAVSPSLVELVPGYGVRLTQRQLDEAISESGGAPTKLIRKLVSVFFSREELAESSCYGLRNNNALDKDILAACIKFVQDRYDVSKAVLVDAVNDKCSGCRRKK
uniref:BEN domain-containing protein n=1 Tax=Amphimedon queenslandica TaxID=400682 RepID=A0A1X7SQT8_AMPQE